MFVGGLAREEWVDQRLHQLWEADNIGPDRQQLSPKETAEAPAAEEAPKKTRLERRAAPQG